MINENSKISLGIAISLIGGGAAWLSSMAVQQNANAKALDVMEIRQIEYTKSIQNIEKDMAVVKTKLELINNKIERKY